MPFCERSAFAKFRCGVAPIRLETGRYENLPLEERCCFNCFNTVEDEYHVILHCPVYNDLRQVLFTESLKIDEHFNSFTDCQKMVFLFSNQDIIRLCAKTCNFILKRRREVLYCK